MASKAPVTSEATEGPVDSTVSHPDQAVRGARAAEAADRVQYEHFRVSAKDEATATPLFQAGQVHEQDAIRVTVEFPDPAYCFLIACNPAGARKRVQLCFPDASDTPQSSPSDAIRFPSLPGQGFYFTDGPGQQVFVLVRSTRPLPPFDSWRSALADLESVSSRVTGRWFWEDGQLVPWNRRYQRGQVRDLQSVTAFVELCRSIESMSADYRVDAVTFPVLPQNASSPD